MNANRILGRHDFLRGGVAGAAAVGCGSGGHWINNLLAFAKPRWQWLSAIGILSAYWLAFVCHPSPGGQISIGRRLALGRIGLISPA